MNRAVILAGGTGQRMGLGMPKQFIKLYGKPIICYTLDVFEELKEIDEIIIPCNSEWIEHLRTIIEKYGYKKVKTIINGGKNRQESIHKALLTIEDNNISENDITIIHDGVRPLVRKETIEQNIEVTLKKGNAITVKRSIETVVVTANQTITMDDIYNREETYILTAPQTFCTKKLLEMYRKGSEMLPNFYDIPDTALLYAKFNEKLYYVIEEGTNIKITTPEDYYYLKSYIELTENKNIFGI